MSIDHRLRFGYAAFAVLAMGLASSVMGAFLDGQLSAPLVWAVNAVGALSLAIWSWFWIESVRFGQGTRGSSLLAAAFLCWALGHIVLVLPNSLGQFPDSPSWLFEGMSLLDIPGAALRAAWPLLLAFGMERTGAFGRPVVVSAMLWGVADLVLSLARTAAFQIDSDGWAFDALKLASGYPVSILMWVFLGILGWALISPRQEPGTLV